MTRVPSAGPSGTIVSKGQEVARYTLFPSSLGPVGAAYTDRGVCMLMIRPTSGDACERELERMRFQPVRDDSRAGELQAALEAFLAGEPFPLPVDLSHLTLFHQAVLEVCRTIPRSEVRTYGWLARRVGRPRATRAVGRALALNPVAVVVPCHRVVPAGGGLGNYSGGGPDVKRYLLTREGAFPPAGEAASSG